MNIASTLNVLRAAIARAKPILLRGQPGLGKTQLCEQISAELGREFLAISPGLLDRTDLMGVPMPNGCGKIIRSLDDLLESIFCAPMPLTVLLDELGQAENDQQSACAPLLWGRKLGHWKLPDHVSVIGATNRTEDKAGSRPILTQIASRFVTQITLDIDAPGWLRWAAASGVDYRITSYLSAHPAHLCNFDATRHYQAQQAFACPRSWSHASEVLEWQLEGSDRREALAGTIGQEIAPALCAHLDLLDAEINIPAILKDGKYKWPKEVPAQLGLAIGIGAMAGEETAPAIVTLAETMAIAGHKNYAVMAVTQACATWPGIMFSPAWKTLMAGPLAAILQKTRMAK